MKDSQFQEILAKWLEDPQNEEWGQRLETELGDNQDQLRRFNKIREDYNRARADEIPENPFFFSKLKTRMEGEPELQGSRQSLRWAVYVATVSLSLLAGVFLGGQYETGTVLGDEINEQFAEELLLDDYAVEVSYVVEIEENAE